MIGDYQAEQLQLDMFQCGPTASYDDDEFEQRCLAMRQRHADDEIFESDLQLGRHNLGFYAHTGGLEPSQAFDMHRKPSVCQDTAVFEALKMRSTPELPHY